MLSLPDKAADFDYGLKQESDADNEAEKLQKEEVKPSTSKQEPRILDDAFLMVTQANWEDDVIWNGEDIKHKVFQKLNSKSNAAGWVPSSYNRTAGSMTGKLTGSKPQTMHLKKPLNANSFHTAMTTCYQSPIKQNLDLENIHYKDISYPLFSKEVKGGVAF